MINDEAALAAARAFYGTALDDVSPEDLAVAISEARAALEASAPAMFAQALEEAVEAFPLETIAAPDSAVAWMMRRAEELRSNPYRSQA